MIYDEDLKKYIELVPSIYHDSCMGCDLKILDISCSLHCKVGFIVKLAKKIKEDE